MTPFLSSYHFLLGPLSAMAAVVATLGACRWVFSTAHRDRRSAAERSAAGFGLLVPVTSPSTRAQAERARDTLVAAGMRATVAESRPPRGPVRVTADGHVQPEPEPSITLQLLVFPDDLERARLLLAA